MSADLVALAERADQAAAAVRGRVQPGRSDDGNERLTLHFELRLPDRLSGFVRNVGAFLRDWREVLS